MNYPEYPVKIKDSNGNKCLKCGHVVCSICLDWCDELIQDENGEWEPCECFYSESGGCVYEETNTNISTK